ncbi:MAG: segregation/condensation protein A [Lachnospiraceae bacterium]|nr:segregation/condensation protein A [Lachnospiraceae bacterium]
MAISVHLEAFDGPLDLLLHLIEKNKVDIYDIPIAMITDQYMEYLEEAKSRDLGIMSEFLVMAATLLDIKCRMLLPREVDEEGEEIDPRDEMVRQLLEYKMYKYMSMQLRDLQSDADLSLSKKSTIPPEIAHYTPPIDYDELVGDMNLQKLGEIFDELLKRQADKIDPVRSKFGTIEKEEIDLTKKLSHIFNYAKEHRRFSFRDLMEKQSSKAELVVTFLVVLEYIKTGRFVVTQDELFSDISIEYTGTGEEEEQEELLNEIS